MEFGFERHTGCNFYVSIVPVDVVGNFTSVSGLDAEIEYERYVEGGTFQPVYLAKGLKYSNIVLKRGTVQAEPLALWFESVRTGMTHRYPMVITMLNQKRVPVKIWTVLDTMPVKIDYGELDAMSGRVMLTSIELAHGEIIPIM